MKGNLKWERELNISTEGVDYLDEDASNYGYDPTPYVVLERMVQLGYINEDSVVVDYGCGKGRVGFFLASQLGCRVVGIDHCERMIEDANENLKSYAGGGEMVFIRSKAEDYCPLDADCLYFFNPFSTAVFRKVLERVGESVSANPREVLIFFYHSTIEYRLYLPTERRLEPVKSISFSEEDIDDSKPARLDVFRFTLRVID